MPEPLPNVRLQLLNTPENVVLVRGMLAGLADELRIGESDLNDIRTAATEACNNVVLHAYGGDPGPMEIDVHIDSGTVTVLVRDSGSGIGNRHEAAQANAGDAEESFDVSAEATDYPPPGIGLHVIQTLAHRVEFRRPPSGGTEVQMRFSLPVKALDPCSDERGLATLALSETPSTAMFSIAPLSLARTILPRLVSALAARAHFSTDRISDAQLLADALAAHVPGALSGNQLSVGVNVGPREIELHIAPLNSGAAQHLLEDCELDRLGGIVEKLTDHHQVARIGPFEALTLGLRDNR
ncbi:MAG: ATP-binding protein [Solirubrobacteraceae bacterium]